MIPKLLLLEAGQIADLTNMLRARAGRRQIGARAVDVENEPTGSRVEDERGRSSVGHLDHLSKRIEPDRVVVFILTRVRLGMFLVEWRLALDFLAFGREPDWFTDIGDQRSNRISKQGDDQDAGHDPEGADQEAVHTLLIGTEVWVQFKGPCTSLKIEVSA